ncbi:hypothetical protein [Serratia plymuthica]|nr:hypothetical protein [Serratia plymuthica]QPS57930.1 hypothetical protein I6G53_10700 [Serratia plymuthica]UNK30106.1 hypothetical protein MNO11_10365 [Serratia plymuthica]CAI1993631.1 Uncharacterised protein [Serratia plymuthica]
MLKEMTKAEMQLIGGAGTAIGIMATAAFINIGGQCNKDSGRDRGVPFR